MLDSLPGDEPPRGGGIRTATLVVRIVLLGAGVLLALAWVSGIFAGFGHTASTLRGDAPDAAGTRAGLPRLRRSVALGGRGPDAGDCRALGLGLPRTATAVASVSVASPTVSVAPPPPIPTGTVAPVTGNAASAAGSPAAGSTPLDAAVAWRDAMPVHERLVESRTYAAPGGPAGRRPHLRLVRPRRRPAGLVTVIPVNGGWEVSQAAYCP